MEANKSPSGGKKEGRSHDRSGPNEAEDNAGTLQLRRRFVKHPIRLFLIRLSCVLELLAWLGLPNYRRDGWKEEK